MPHLCNINAGISPLGHEGGVVKFVQLFICQGMESNHSTYKPKGYLLTVVSAAPKAMQLEFLV